MRAMAARLASRTRLDRAWGWLRAEVQRTWTAIRQKLTEKLGQAWGWLRAKARRLWAAIWQMLTGTTTRAISTLVIVALVIAIPLLIFVPKCQATHIADDATRLEREDNARRTLAQIVGGAVGLIVIWITWRRLQVAQEGQVTERFSRAIDHLGNNSLDVRLGAIYALERIARDSRQDHGPIMEILTAYVRERAPRDPSSEDQQPTDDESHVPTFSDEELLPTSALATDVQAALTVIGRRQTGYDPPEQVLNLMRTDLGGGNLVQASLQSALLGEANLQKAKLWSANLQGALLIRASLREANFVNANLQRAELVGAQLQHAVFQRADLRKSGFTGASMDRASLVGANLQKAVLNGAHLQGASFLLADLQGADLKEADLRKADFQQADLRRADLTGANLQKATLFHANLQGADLTEADLRGASLIRASGLTSQQLAVARGDDTTRLSLDIERPAHWPAEREDAG